MDDYPTHGRQWAPIVDRVKLYAAGLACCSVLLLVLLVPPHQDRNKARSYSCLSNLKQQGLAVLQYSQDYDESLPSGGYWMDAVQPYIKNESVFQCPGLATGDRNHTPQLHGLYGYAYYSRLSGISATSVKEPELTVLTYDSNTRLRNRADMFTSLPRPGRHPQGNNVSLLDGHAKQIKDNALGAFLAHVKSMTLLHK